MSGCVTSVAACVAAWRITRRSRRGWPAVAASGLENPFVAGVWGFRVTLYEGEHQLLRLGQNDQLGCQTINASTAISTRRWSFRSLESRKIRISASSRLLPPRTNFVILIPSAASQATPTLAASSEPTKAAAIHLSEKLLLLSTTSQMPKPITNHEGSKNSFRLTAARLT